MTKAQCHLLSNDPWLTEIMGKPCFRLALDDAKVPEDGEISLAGVRLTYAKIPTDAIGSIHWLEDNDFRLIDTNVTLKKSILTRPAKTPDVQTNTVIRFAKPEDRTNVMALAGSSFSRSRFHLDPKIPDATADKIKAEWAGNFFRGDRGDAMVVAETNGDIVGFLQLLHKGRSLTIDLIATAATARGKGLGRAMIDYAERSMPDLDEINVGTQLANGGSLIFYQSLGFRLQQAAYVFHNHRDI